MPKGMQNTVRWAVVDVETGADDNRIHDIGALRHDGAVYHDSSREGLMAFLRDVDYVCGHNIIHHDAPCLFGDRPVTWQLVDTLYMSPLLFPERPYHRLVKDDKLMSEQLNNPVNDCEKARDLLMEEIAAWRALPEEKRNILTALLEGQEEFSGFISMAGDGHDAGETPALPGVRLPVAGEPPALPDLIREMYAGRICGNASVETLIDLYPCELAYALALIDTTDHRSVTPGWVLRNYPGVEYVMQLLRHTHCAEGCDYCRRQLDVHYNLKTFFGYDSFRTYEGEPLQERAARAAVGDCKSPQTSLLAIFPTGGGKSLTFQLPALMAGRTVHGLTVVISPLQSLMKDQVDSLAERGITDAVTINGLLDPITRSTAIKQVQDGEASLLYIAPEMLRSKTIERILLQRHVVRFVIDEAHCFSSWGQDFRVDYLYIGKFISDYQKKKGCRQAIPVSCFTATAKQKVIQDICDYFRQTLYLDLQLFATTATRTNLHYSVIHADTDEDKYQRLRALLAEHDCPAIVYVARTRRTHELSSRLTRDGYHALPFNGKMDSDDKVHNQEAFMKGEVRIIVATSAFGMGVDKKDVGLVVHYNISDSLENYVQEAGRAGRDPQLNAQCYVLYSDSDLDKHFVLLNQSKLSISEIQQVWRAVKDMTRQRRQVSCSALEIARKAGWSDAVHDVETRVRTAIAALEQTGYLERGNNVPHVYATGITVRNVDEARQRITESVLFGADERENAVRIIKSLITQKHIAKAQDSEAESRIDYLADILGMTKGEVVSAVVRMRQEGILADSRDITAWLPDGGNAERRSKTLFENFARLEQFILDHLTDEGLTTSCKLLNDEATNAGIASSREKDIRTLLYFLTIKSYIRKREDAIHGMTLTRQADKEATTQRSERRWEICRFALEWLQNHQTLPRPLPVGRGVYTLADDNSENKGNYSPPSQGGGGSAIQFSIVELLNQLKASGGSLFTKTDDLQIDDVEEALLYLSIIGVLKLDGGFMVLYNAMDLRRLKDNKQRYKQDDYRMLNEFYKQKIQQVHIVGEYANLMVRDYAAAQQYVRDYFLMDYKRFIAKYFKGERGAEIQRNLTAAKYRQLFGKLSERQKEIIADKESHCIIVAAGPGSGKTRVLVHKLASLLLMEDVKHEQLLMLTFSRAAATEFRQRLKELIGDAAHFVDIKTFHAYSFDLLGRTGNLDDAKDVVSRAAKMIAQGEVEPSKTAKTVLVIDEAQDMSAEEYALVKALMETNETMRVIAVGDDDQNIFGFRGSDSKYMFMLAEQQTLPQPLPVGRGVVTSSVGYSNDKCIYSPPSQAILSLSGQNLQVGGGSVGSSSSVIIEMTENYRSSHSIVAYANNFVRTINGRMKTTPITAMRDEQGSVSLTRHVSQYMYQPLVKELLRNCEEPEITYKTHESYKSHKSYGSVAVLTQTNEEAAILVALLHHHGVDARLVQSMEGFRFWNLAEVRYLLKYLNRRLCRGSGEALPAIIPQELWEEAKRKTFETYATSQALGYLRRCCELFEQTSGKAMYMNDLHEFVFESSVEDFCDVGEGVTVSTIHKAKGREFDDVYMLLADRPDKDNDLFRQYYVGMTRARNRLFIHTNGSLFDFCSKDFPVQTTPTASSTDKNADPPTFRFTTDRNQYPLPEEIVLQLSHRDVFLSYFRQRKQEILSLRSGDALTYHDFMLCLPQSGVPVALLSRDMQTRLQQWQQKGYQVDSATVRFIVAWKPKEAPKSEPETAVLLADLTLKYGQKIVEG